MIKLINDDFFNACKTLDDNSFDLIFVDPPYNLQLQEGNVRKVLTRFNGSVVEGCYEEWDQFSSFAAYDEFCEKWLKECKRLLKESGTLMSMGSYHNSYRVGRVLQDLDYWILAEVVWEKCLIGDTKVFVKNDNGWISQSDLRSVWDNGYENYQILSPAGWKKIQGMSVNKTLREIHKVSPHGDEPIFCSGNHKFPVSSRMYNSVTEKTPEIMESMKSATGKGFLLHSDISPFIDGDVRSLNVISITKDLEKLFCVGGYTEYKKCHGIGEQRRYLVKKYPGLNLDWYCTRDLFPVSLCNEYELEINNVTTYKSRNNEVFPSDITLDYDFGYLIGLYSAEGNIDNTQVRFSLHAEETLFADRVENVMKKFNVETYRFVKNNSQSVYFGSRIMVDVINYLISGKAKTKKLNMDFILNTNEDFRKGILNGFLDGDGYPVPGRDMWQVGLASKDLISDIQILASTLGKRVYVYSPRKASCITGGEKKYDIYSLSVNSRKEKIVDGHKFHPTNYFVEKTDDLCDEWYDMTIEDGLFIVGSGIVVHNSNPQPSHRGVRPTPAHENIIWAKYNQKATGYTFNNMEMKKYNDGKQIRDVWKIPLCGGKERLRYPKTEDQEPREFGKKVHPTQKPEMLLKMAIEMSTKEGDWILDPFSGVGTTGKVAQDLNRNCIMVERESEYCKWSRKRIGIEQI